MTNISSGTIRSGFKAYDQYRSTEQSGYRLLPFRFTDLSSDRVFASNLVGEFVTMQRTEVHDLINGDLDRDHPQYDELRSKHFIYENGTNSCLDLLSTKYRTKHDILSDFTALHLFVVSLRCDHSCPYCQVSRVSEDKVAYDMSEETADKVIDLMFMSPSDNLKVEFQGGESLLNFGIIKYVVERTKTINADEGRNIQFVIASNLSLLDDEILDYCKEHDIYFSTSLDGPEELHNKNRPRPESDSHQRAISGIVRIREKLGPHAVSALMTTTRKSLEQPEAIIDEYLSQGFDSIFLRWLSPYGFAVKTAKAIGYDAEKYNEFYERGLRYILEINRNGIPFREEYASIVLQKMLTPYESGYVDLQSPAGIGISVIAYNYNGDVFASDESRMLAEQGDLTFKMGNVHENDYEDLFLNSGLVEMISDSMTMATPGCADCAFEPYCGTDPVTNYATQGDIVGHRPTSTFCSRNMHVFKLLTEILENEPQNSEIIKSWVGR